MTLQSESESARGCIPQADGAIPVAADQGLSIGTEGHTVDSAYMALQGVLEGARGYVPEVDGFQIAAGQGLAVGTEGHAADPTCMALQSVPEGARGHVPEVDDAVPAAAGQGPSIGTEGHTVDRPRMAGEQGFNFVGSGIIQPDANTAPNRQERAVRRIPHDHNRAPPQTGLGPDRQGLRPGFPGRTGHRHGQEQAQACG